VHIELELQAGENPAKVKTALYAFTSCEKSIASRPIVLDGGRPRAMTITQILQRNVDRLMFLTKRELEIRLDELDSLFHARTLDRIFVEERIYKRIESEKTYEGVQKAVLDGFKPFRAELRRDVTLEDGERLLKIPIRRISQFDIDKNRDEIKNILAEELEVKDNLVHLRAFTVKYLKGLISQYKKKYPRCTQISKGAFQQADVRKLTASELSVKIDRDNHYIGTDLRGADELFKCSSLDEILCVWKDGRFKKIQPPDKFFVDKDIMEIFLFQQEKDRDKEYTCVYEEPLYGFAYVKRFTFGGLIRNKEYRIAPPKSKILYFAAGCPDQLYVKFKPAKGQKIHQQMFDPKEVTVRGSTARGIQMTTKPIARCSASKGSWWDESEAPSKGVLL
jgi:topoisomerase-4 subunit A